MGRIDMTYDEVKRRMKNGATAQVIADLNGVTVQAVNAFIRRNKEAEAGVPEMLAPVETEQEQKKLLVDRDVYEEIVLIIQNIEGTMIEYERQLDELANRRNQFEQIRNLLGVRE